MQATLMETGWLIRSENNKEELELAHFLKVHEHLSFSTSSTEFPDEADTPESTVPLVNQSQN
ncbi:MAG: hypothetical protein LV481_14140 [Methylacidiphilales bacterium]|nr:hypothetical protein [Candidatus Methylacidiphilales bacterium]